MPEVAHPWLPNNPMALPGTGQICHHQLAAFLPYSTAHGTAQQRAEHTSEPFPQILACYMRCKNVF